MIVRMYGSVVKERFFMGSRSNNHSNQENEKKGVKSEGVKRLFFVLAQPKKHLAHTGPPAVALLNCKRRCNTFLDFPPNCDFSQVF
jgi:hypothetical protein